MEDQKNQEPIVRKTEAPIKDYLATFKFFDSKHRRLSIFAKVDPISKKLVITVLTISKTPEIIEHRILSRKGDVLNSAVEFIFDTFSKKQGRKIYEKECMGADCTECPGQYFAIDVVDDRPRFTFLQWCNNRYDREVKEEKVIIKKKYVRGTAYVHPEKKKKEEVIATETAI